MIPIAELYGIHGNWLEIYIKLYLEKGKKDVGGWSRLAKKSNHNRWRQCMTSFNLNTSIQCIKINKKIILLAQCQTKYKTILHNKSLGQYYEADGVVQ